MIGDTNMTNYLNRVSAWHYLLLAVLGMIILPLVGLDWGVEQWRRCAISALLLTGGLLYIPGWRALMLPTASLAFLSAVMASVTLNFA